MTPHRTGLRLFVALYPPAEAVVQMLTDLRTLDLTPHRETDPARVHMTLHFIGDTPANNLSRVQESVERSVAGIGSFELTPGRLISLPARGEPRLVAAETDAPAPLTEIVRRLATRLSRRPHRDPAAHFVPHLTLCRFTQAANAPAPLPMARPLTTRSFPVHSISLMRSVLLPQGARHDPVSMYRLAAARQTPPQ